MIYLYAVAPRVTDLPRTRGIAGAKLRTVDTGPLSGVCSSHERLDVRLDVQSAWEHEQVVEALMQLGPVLPARFGTTFESLAALELVLEREAEELECGLAQVCGCVELALRVRTLPPDKVRFAVDGHAYMRDVLKARRRREATITHTMEPLNALAVSSKETATASRDVGVSVSYLVRAHDVDRFCAEVRRIQQENRKLALSCTGPWAPYSFSSHPAAR